jgi:hypothetical protein
MIGYQVGEEFFYNKYLALYNSSKNNKSIQFFCNNQEYDQLDWGKEPEQSFEELMTAHAFYLRNKYERLILGWSGGTDSHTIYNIFKKNKIRIDEIIVKTSNRLMYQPKLAADWLRKNHYDNSTIITEYDQYDDYYRMIDRPNEDWIWKNSGDILHSGVNTNGLHTQTLIEEKYGGKNYIYVCGLAEPYLIYKDDSWYSCVCDRSVANVMGYNYNIEYFFLNSLLLIKQSYLLKKKIKELLKKNTTININKILEKYQRAKNENDYYDYKKSIGRYDELIQGVSHKQKLAYFSQTQLDFSKQTTYKELINHRDAVCNNSLSSENKISYIFTRGLFNLSLEKKFINFLHDNKHVNGYKLLSLSPMYSKLYKLSI